MGECDGLLLGDDVVGHGLVEGVAHGLAAAEGEQCEAEAEAEGECAGALAGRGHAVIAGDALSLGTLAVSRAVTVFDCWVKSEV